MIVVFGGEKGGTGKSTQSVIQAAYRAGQGREVLLLDADTQKSAMKWSAIRTQSDVQPFIACFPMYGATLAEQVRKLRDKYDDIIIDTRGADAPELRSALLVADMIVTPIQPGQFDIFTLATMDQLVKDARGFNPGLQARILTSMASTHPKSTDEEDMQEVCEVLDSYQLLSTLVCYRKAYKVCAREGRACHEVAKGDEKAVEEMECLAEEIWA